jgi:hypothetical protein
VLASLTDKAHWPHLANLTSHASDRLRDDAGAPYGPSSQGGKIPHGTRDGHRGGGDVPEQVAEAGADGLRLLGLQQAAALDRLSTQGLQGGAWLWATQFFKGAHAAPSA